MPLYNNIVYPSGSTMLFQQSTSPVGWIKDTSAGIHNRALRIVGSGGAGGVLGGSVGLTTWAVNKTYTSGSHIVTLEQTPAHTHNTYMDTGSNTSDSFWTSLNNRGTSVTTGGSGWTGTTGHTHTISMNMSVQYVDVIVSTKD